MMSKTTLWGPENQTFGVGGNTPIIRGRLTLLDYFGLLTFKGQSQLTPLTYY